MKRLIMFLTALAPAGANAQPPDDARAVLAAVLAQQAAQLGPEGAAETCVVRALQGAPTAPNADDDFMPDHAVRIQFQWHALPAAASIAPPNVRPVTERHRYRNTGPPVPAPAALAAADSARLDAARIAAASQAPAPIAEVDAALVPMPLRFQAVGNEDCATISLTPPVIAGDTAFVELAYACGPVCGSGNIYALERREGRWQVAGIADMWIR